MTSALAEEVKKVERDNSRLSEIRNFLENCYCLSFSKDSEEILKAITHRLSVAMEAIREAEAYIKEAVSHVDCAKQVIDSDIESGDRGQLFSEQIEKSRKSIRNYWRAKARGFELLKDIVDNFWSHLPYELQDVFDDWAKDLAIQVAEEESEEQINLLTQEVLKLLPIELNLTAEEVAEKIKQSMKQKRDEGLVKAKLNFVASVFRAGTEAEENNPDDCFSSFKKQEGEISGSALLKSGEIVEVKLRDLEAFWEKNGDKIAVRTCSDMKPRRTTAS